MTEDRDRLSDEEWRQFTHLLHRFCDVELDQWENWVVDSRWGEVYLHLGRSLPPGHEEHHYTRVPRPAPTTDSRARPAPGGPS